MTTLLAYHDGERGYMATDSRCMAGNEIVSDSVPKITRAGKWLIASAGASLARNLVAVNADKLADAETMWEVGCRLKQIFKDSGWDGEAIEKGEARRIDACFLVAGPGVSGIIFSNFSSQEQDRPCPGGSGGVYAVGAFMGALRIWQTDAHLHAPSFPVAVNMSMAIRIACLYDQNSGGEPQVEVTE